MYELDDRKSAPIEKCKRSQDTFLTDAAAACKEYNGERCTIGALPIGVKAHGIIA